MRRHGYVGILGRWDPGVYDIRHLPNYEHRWLVVTPWEVEGCYTREEARDLYRQLYPYTKRESR